MEGKVIIFSAPSGAGKSTIVSHLLKQFPQLEFSVSATSRAPRGEEQNGREYYFMTNSEFKQGVANEMFVEWEEVYGGTLYGTLRSELDRIWGQNHVIVFDVDVKGGLKLKELFGDRALAIFIMPPSVEELRRRLVGRGTDSEETIAKRVGKAETELLYAPKFDTIIVNDNLADALKDSEQVVSDFLKR